MAAQRKPIPSNLDHITGKLRAIRQGSNVTQAKLAARIHVQMPTLSRWELGKQAMPVDMAVKYAEALGLRLAIVR